MSLASPLSRPLLHFSPSTEPQLPSPMAFTPDFKTTRRRSSPPCHRATGEASLYHPSTISRLTISHNEPSPRLRDDLLVAPTGDTSLAASPTARTDRMYIVSGVYSCYAVAGLAESAYGWLCATTLFDNRSMIGLCVDSYVLAIPWFSVHSCPQRRVRHVDAQLATSSHTLSPRHAPHHLDAGLVTSKPGSPPRRAAWDLNTGLATSTRSSPRPRAARHLVARLATSSRASPPRHAPRHLDTRLTTSTQGSSRRSQARHLNARLDLNARLVTPMRGSAPRHGARHANAGLGTSTRGLSRRRGACHVDAGLVTSTRGLSRRRGACHVDAGLGTSTLGLPRRCAAHHLDFDAGLAMSTCASPLRHAPHQQDVKTHQKRAKQLQRAATNYWKVWQNYRQTTPATTALQGKYGKTTGKLHRLQPHYVNAT
ncbi:hypothetical protein K438DRAFT_2001070 [Mycena galopus ATCC 62051]|nr:hypothetical protein K438DRAFT_2001070 [Mycena galopus ATCC 62051]